MNRLLLAFGALLASALLIPGDAEAQRGGRGGGGFSGGGARMGGGGFDGGSRMYIPRAGMGGGYRQAAISNPGGRFDNRLGYGSRYGGRYGYRTAGYGGRYPYYGGGYYGRRYPYYGLGAGLVTGSLVGAAATYPYSDYGYDYPYSGYSSPYYGSAYEGPVDGAGCWQGPPLCTAAGYMNLGYLRRLQGAPF